MIKTSFGATRDEAQIGVACLYGFKATIAQFKAVIGRETDSMVAVGDLLERDGLLSVGR